MERKIQWNSGCFDEIDLVYDKAAAKEITAKILSDLEAGALAEAKAHSGMIRMQDRSITPEQYDGLPENAKEQLIAALSDVGISSFAAQLTESKIIVRLSPQIQQVHCCTAFSILNRLEKLDGAFNVLHPQATLEIQAPLGGKRGLVQIEMLISMLYPWLKVTEVSSSEVAPNLAQTQDKVPQKYTEQQPSSQNPMTQNKQNTPTAKNCNNRSQSKGNAKSKKFSPLALIIAIIASLILVKGSTMLYSSVQPATAPPTLSAISGKDLVKGEYYYGNVRVLCSLGHLISKGSAGTLSNQYYLAAFEDADSVWNYVILEPQPTRPIEGELYSGCFEVEERNETITGWKDETIDLYDGEFFDPNVERYDTTFALRGSFGTIDEYIKDYNDYQAFDILGAVAVLAIGLGGLCLAWKAHKAFKS